MKYVVKSPIKSGGKIRPPGTIRELEDVDPGLIPGVLEPYQEPVPDPPVPAELLQLEPLPEPKPVPPPVAPPEPKPAPKLPAFPKTKTKKR